MPETRTVAESDRLLDLLNEARAENQRLRDELDQQAAGARGSLADMTAARDLIAQRRDEAIEAGRRERDEAIAQRDQWMETSRASGTKLLRVEGHAGDRHEQIQGLRDDLAASQAANDALRAALKTAERERDEAIAERGRATWILSTRDQQFIDRCAELKAEIQAAETARVDAQVMQYTAEAECEQLRRELAQVRAALAPLWPAADDGTPADLARLAAAAIDGHRATADRPSRSCTVGQMIGCVIGAAVVAAGVAGELARGLPW